MIIEIREMDGASELDVQLARYNATKIARDNGAITIIEQDDEISASAGSVQAARSSGI